MNRFVKLERSFNLLSQRERVLITVTSGLLLFVIWFMVLQWPFSMSVKRDNTKITRLIKQNKDFVTQISVLTKKLSKNDLDELKTKKEILQKRVVLLDRQFGLMTERLLTKKAFSNSIRVMLRDTKKLHFESFSNLPAKLIKEPHEVVGNLSQTENVYQLGIVLNFQGSYFNTLSYLQSVEKLGLPLFWSSLDYNVTNYPDANITIKLQALSEQEGFIRAE